MACTSYSSSLVSCFHATDTPSPTPITDIHTHTRAEACYLGHLSSLPAYLLACLPACLSARLPACLLARLPACPHARLPARPPACPPARLVPAISNYSTTPICAAQLLLYFPSVPCVATSMQLHDSAHGITIAPPWKRCVWQQICQFLVPLYRTNTNKSVCIL